jgi:hypothetical protein
VVVAARAGLESSESGHARLARRVTRERTTFVVEPEDPSDPSESHVPRDSHGELELFAGVEQ